MSDVRILIVDDDEGSQHALQQVLDSEGWRVRVVPFASEALRELARGHWTLVIVNIALADITGPLFTTLKELSQADDLDASQKGLRVLFLVPLLAARWARPVLDKERLPYAMKPLNLNDFLEKVSDLLLEVGALAQPIRDVSVLAVNKEHRPKERSGRDRRNGKMFASREDYTMTEEEIADYEKQEEEERKKSKEEEKKREML
ncbi:MAG TPA: response regulator [Candidatus Acidoferrales bacterium]|nr:response regulator [Candidatus Acidoferrales bacterium]